VRGQGSGALATRRRKALATLFSCLVAVDLGLWVLALAASEPDAVVGGHRVVNSFGLLSAAMTRVDKAYGYPISELQAAGQGDDPDKCFFLRAPTGVFTHYVTCGGAFFDHYCSKDCGQGDPEVDFVLAVPFKLTKGKAGWEGEISGKPVAWVGSAVKTGLRLWRPDGNHGRLVDLGHGTLEALVTSTWPTWLVAGAIALFPVPVAMAVVGAMWSNSPRREKVDQVALAKQAWQSLARVAFAPPLEPPRPVLVTPGAALPAARARAVTAGEAAPSWATIAGEPEVPGADEAVEQEVTPASDPYDQPAPPPPQPEGRKVFVRLLGPPEAEGWAEPPTRQKTTELLVYLALHKERPVGTEKLRTALWPYQPGKPDVSPGTVHQELSRLRRCLGAEHFPEAKGGYQLAESVETDWGHFQALAEAATALPEDKGTEVLKEALALVRGQPFEGAGKGYGWAFDEVLVAKIEMAVAKAAHLASARCLALGRLDEAEWAVAQALRAGPGDEQVWEDKLAVAAARGGWAALDRAFHDAERACGPQPPGTVLFDAYQRLRDGR
jgi:DNA-binding SARP family transcriptional activator